MTNKPPADIPEYGNVRPTKGFSGESESKIPPERSAFESYMSTTPGQEIPKTTMPSPYEIQTQQKIPSFQSLNAQTENTQNNLQNIKNTLQENTNLQFKGPQVKLLTTKFKEANKHLNRAAQHVGLKQLPSTTVPTKGGPVQKFLAYINDGQNQLVKTKQKLEDISSGKIQISPSQMLLAQVNLAQAQQEIEFSSVLLGKVVDSLKQMMSIQL